MENHEHITQEEEEESGTLSLSLSPHTHKGNPYLLHPCIEPETMMMMVSSLRPHPTFLSQWGSYFKRRFFFLDPAIIILNDHRVLYLISCLIIMQPAHMDTFLDDWISL